ncbi:MAG: hypothetical protein IKF78_05835 [Atopobiaceae bacterium]|nr:hypothetical protein [Atopobiaceae bacterium]
MGKRWELKRPVAVVTSIVLAFSLAVTPGVASAGDAQDELAAGATAMGDVPEWAVDDGFNASALAPQSTLPKKYDLRSDGLVTPVKNQSPWNTCWAFAGIAAAETSMLSANGSTAEESRLDLSERHLAYFALHPVTEVDDPVQAGEGLVTVSGDSNAAFAAGGMSMYITTLFSQGVGPHTEAMFPYRGKNGTRGFVPVITFEEFEKDPEQGTLITLAAMHGTDVEAQKAALEAEAANRGMDYTAVLAEAIAELRGQYAGGSYARDDDWSIPEKGDDGRSNRTLNPVLTMKDGNVLPEYWNDQNKTQLNDASVAAMKQELVYGRGVSIAYTADQAQPGQTADTRYINHDTWAQYTFEPERSTHAVCIVGYDDDYLASNFKHDVLTRATDGNGNWVVDANGGYVLAKDENGQPYVDPAATEASMPPGNGAWIVKNSWGSETDKTTDDLGNVTGNGTYGVRDADGKATGYFYLSYYDRSILRPETMAFSAGLLDDSDSFEVLQHDYMAAQNGFYTTEASSDVTSSANVFEVPHDLSIKAVSTLMPEENQHVTFSIYRMDDGATTPTDGTMLYRTSCNFEYAGFHRLDLEWPVAVKAGEKISVVSTASTLNADGARTYKVSATQAISKEVADVVNTNGVVLPIYGNAVVNKGESFLYKDGAWVDWSEYLAGLPKPPEEEGDPHISGDAYTDMYPVDNFSIKLYAVPAEITLTHKEAKAATCTEPGNIEYWYYDTTDTSEGQRLYYKDKDGKEKIDPADTVIAPLGHKWGAWTELDGEQHQRVCERDSSHVEKAEHDWNEGEVTTEPTATKDGVRTRICKDCGATKTESIPATGSARKGDDDNAKTGGAATTPKTRTPSTGDPMAALPALAAMGLSGLVLLEAGSRMHVDRRRNKGDES